MPGGAERDVADVVGEVELGVRSPLWRGQPPQRRNHPLAQPRHLGHRPGDVAAEVVDVDGTVEDQQRAAAGVEPRVLVEVPHQRLGVAHPPLETLLSSWPRVGRDDLQPSGARPAVSS